MLDSVLNNILQLLLGLVLTTDTKKHTSFNIPALRLVPRFRCLVILFLVVRQISGLAHYKAGLSCVEGGAILNRAQHEEIPWHTSKGDNLCCGGHYTAPFVSIITDASTLQLQPKLSVRRCPLFLCRLADTDIPPESTEAPPYFECDLRNASNHSIHGLSISTAALWWRGGVGVGAGGWEWRCRCT